MLEKTEKAGRKQRIETRLDGILNLMDIASVNSGTGDDEQEAYKCCRPWGCKASDHQMMT